MSCSVARNCSSVFVAGLVVFTGCSDTAGRGALASGVEVTDSAGVTTVRSLDADRTGVLDSEAVFTLGGKETPEESFYQVSSWNVAADGDGNLYVLDRNARLVQVFDSIGRHLRTFGGQGGGPGELLFPFGLTTAGDGRVWVVDVGKRALVRWGPDGNVLSQESLPEGYVGGEVKWTPAGMIFPLRGPDGHRLVVASELGDTVTLASLPLAETRNLQLTSCGMSFSGMEPIFSPHFVWTVSGDTVVIARNPDYVLEVYERGRLVRKLERDISRRPASAELARRSLGDGIRVATEGGERICDPAEVVEQQGYAPYLPMVQRLALASDGTLWVERYSVESDSGPIDIFGPEGRYLATLSEETPFPVGFLPDGRVLVSERDELDVERLVVSKMDVTWPGSDRDI